MVETFLASWFSPTISVPRFTCLDKPLWKKRLFTTSATSTAVLMALPRAFRVSFLAPVLKCIMTAVAYAMIGFLPISIVSGGISLLRIWVGALSVFLGSSDKQFTAGSRMYTGFAEP